MDDLTKTNPLNPWDRHTAEMLRLAIEAGKELLDRQPRKSYWHHERVIRRDLDVLLFDLKELFADAGWL